MGILSIVLNYFVSKFIVNWKFCEWLSHKHLLCFNFLKISFNEIRGNDRNMWNFYYWSNKKHMQLKQKLTLNWMKILTDDSRKLLILGMCVLRVCSKPVSMSVYVCVWVTNTKVGESWRCVWVSYNRWRFWNLNVDWSACDVRINLYLLSLEVLIL